MVLYSIARIVPPGVLEDGVVFWWLNGHAAAAAVRSVPAVHSDTECFAELLADTRWASWAVFCSVQLVPRHWSAN